MKAEQNVYQGIMVRMRAHTGNIFGGVAEREGKGETESQRGATKLHRPCLAFHPLNRLG